MKHELTPRRKERRIMAVWTSLVLTTALFTTSAFAADSDPLTIVNNLSDFIFSCIKATFLWKTIRSCPKISSMKRCTS